MRLASPGLIQNILRFIWNWLQFFLVFYYRLVLDELKLQISSRDINYRNYLRRLVGCLLYAFLCINQRTTTDQILCHP